MRVGRIGNWFGYGRQRQDAISGWLFPEKIMTPQCGGLVSSRWADGSLDLKRYRREEECIPFDGSRNPPALPLVSIEATTPAASKHTGATGVFTFTDLSYVAPPSVVNDYQPLVPTAPSITIFYTIDGSGVNGVDYATIAGSVTIPTGQQSVTLTITPQGAGGAVTVILTLAENAAYQLGYARSATVTIAAA